MYSFLNDYSECAHPRILNNLLAMGTEQNVGYGTDSYCRKAADLIRSLIKKKRQMFIFFPAAPSPI